MSRPNPPNGVVPEVTIEGRAVRNIRIVDSMTHGPGYSFTFEAMHKGQWLKCGPMVTGSFAETEKGSPVWSIPIGYWQLDTAVREFCNAQGTP
jgi:hypothetical protein